MSKYYKEQIQRALSLRDQLFGDPGNGLFKSKHRPFVLNDASLNFHESIRAEAVAYFNRNNIPLWNGTANAPTGHLLSSQVACINHLFFVRGDQAAATALLQGLDANVATALLIDDGYVEFEVVGRLNYLGEKNHTHGANSTSVDAMMLGGMSNGTRKLFFIEWKYTEHYTPDSKAEGAPGVTRLGIYGPLLHKDDCPIIAPEVQALFIEPYYQLMRQTLLAHEMAKANEYGAKDYLHVHVMPVANASLKGKNTSVKLAGGNLDSAWRSCLKDSEKYFAIDPSVLLRPVVAFSEHADITRYLAKRYWD